MTKKTGEDRGLRKFVRDAALTIIGGFVIEPTLKKIHVDIGPYLRQVWLFILVFISFDALARSEAASRRLIDFRNSLTPRKQVMSYLIVAIACGAIGCGYWWALGGVLGADKEDKSRIEKADTFATLVPIVPAWTNSPIPMDTNFQDPHHDFYRDLLGLVGRPDKPPDNWPAYRDRKLEADNGMEFTLRVVQYYVFQSIYFLHRGTSGGIRWTAGVGVTPIQRPPIPPPDAVPYPNDEIIRMLSQNEFFLPGDRMLWSHDYGRLQVPKGTKVSLIEIPANPERGQIHICRVRFERAGFYTLDFDVSAGFGQIGNTPAGFAPQQVPGVVTWNVTIAVHYQIEKRVDEGFKPELYAVWADALFEGLRKKMAF